MALEEKVGKAISAGSTKRLENQTVFVTGGLSGIGKACAIAAAAEGANVVVADIKSVDFDMAMEDIRAENDKAIFVDCDVTSILQVEKAVTATIEAFGSIDVALNDAGIPGEPGRVGDMTEEGWNTVIRVNLTGIFNCMKHELLRMAFQKRGVIVNMSSTLGKVGFAGSAGYAAAKHGIIGLSQSAALEYAQDGIRVNVLCPGIIKTPLLTKSGVNGNEKAKQQITDLHPLGRMGSPEEVAKAFVFLASADSSFITGTALEIDGGYLAQ